PGERLLQAGGGRAHLAELVGGDGRRVEEAARREAGLEVPRDGPGRPEAGEVRLPLRRHRRRVGEVAEVELLDVVEAAAGDVSWRLGLGVPWELARAVRRRVVPC